MYTISATQQVMRYGKQDKKKTSGGAGSVRCGVTDFGAVSVLRTETAAAGEGVHEAAENAAENGAEKDGRSADGRSASSVFYVSADGSDRSGDGSQEFPYASVQKAYDEVEISGQIVVSGTVVIEDYMDILRFTEDKSVRITGENEGCIIYDGDQNIDPDSAVMNVSAGSVELSDITVKMPDIRGKNGRVLYVSETAEVTVGEGTVIENGYLASSSGNLFVAGGGTVTLEGGTIRNGYLAISMRMLMAPVSLWDREVLFS